MELKDTIEIMNSSDYKERFIAEYLQTKIRVQKLSQLLMDLYGEKLRGEKVKFKPACSTTLLNAQYNIMCAYMSILKERARIEGIDLKEYD